MDNQLVEKFWDENVAEYVDALRKQRDLYRNLILAPAFYSMLGPVKGLHILDVACGEGDTSRQLAINGSKVVGIDLSSEMIKAAQEEEKQDPKGIQYLISSACNLSKIKDESFDGAVSTMAMMDIPNYHGALSEVYRVLQNGGFWQFSIHHPCTYMRKRKWVRDNKGQKEKLSIGGYFPVQENQSKDIVEEWHFAGIPDEEKPNRRPMKVPTFFRTLSEYINPLIEIGFSIEAIQEPYADSETVKDHPRFKMTRQVPHFLIVRCRKEKQV